jgi:hypothetical protein
MGIVFKNNKVYTGYLNAKNCSIQQYRGCCFINLLISSDLCCLCVCGGICKKALVVSFSKRYVLYKN